MSSRFPLVVPERNLIETWNDLRPGDLLYDEIEWHYYLIFAEHQLSNLVFIKMHNTGYFSKYRIERSNLDEGDAVIIDSGWLVYRP